MGLELIEYVMGVEEVFDIALPEDLLYGADVKTFGALYVIVCDRLGVDPTAENPPPTPAGWTPITVYARMRLLLAQLIEIPIDEIGFDSRFIDDLGMD